MFDREGGVEIGNHHSDSRHCPAPSCDVPSDVYIAVLERLPPNEVALSARRTCRAAAQHFAEEHHRTAAIGQPLPPHAASGPLEEAKVAVRGHSFSRKFLTLSVAAASGCVANLEVVWRLLQPCIFPELITHEGAGRPYSDEFDESGEEVGACAVKSGNLRVLSWLLEHCPGLVDRPHTLAAAAEHCPLPQLLEVCALLGGADGRPIWFSLMLDAAARSPTPDAIAKMEWVLQQGGGSCKPTWTTAAAAARSGDTARLRWLRDRGCPLDSWQVLASALRHADLSVAEWLVDQAGCPLPADPGQGEKLAEAAACADSGSIAKLRWLQSRGLAILPAGPRGSLALPAAALHGRLDVVQFLLAEGGEDILSAEAMHEALASGCVEVVECLWEAGCPVEDVAWKYVGYKGRLGMARWLLEEAEMPAGGQELEHLIRMWPCRTAEVRRQLLEAVRLVAPPGCGIEVTASAVAIAANQGHLDVLRYLHVELGCGLDELLEEAVRGGCEAVVEWLVEQGCAAGVVAAAAQSASEGGAEGSAGEVSGLEGSSGEVSGLEESSGEESGLEGSSGEESGLEESSGEESGLEASSGGGEAEEWDDADTSAGRNVDVVATRSDRYYLAAGHVGDLATLNCLRRLGVLWSEGVLLKAVLPLPPPLPVLQWMWEQGARLDKKQLELVRQAPMYGPYVTAAKEWLEGVVVGLPSVP